MEEIKDKEIFWLDEWDGECKDGFFIRSDFFKIIEKFEKEFGKIVVGIVKPTGWNLELICKNDTLSEQSEVKDGD